MIGKLFDERFARSAAGIRGYMAVRLALLAAVTGFVAAGLGWGLAGLWAGAALLAEAAVAMATHQTARAADGSAGPGRACAVVYMLAGLTWSMAGVLLWSAEDAASQVAAAAFFAAHLTYIQARHGQSPGAALPMLPSVALPALVPLVLPKFEGTDQALVCLAMLAAALHTLLGLWTSLRASRQLQAAQAAAAARGEAKSAFLARMSHEIRTPLNGVLGMAQALAAAPDLQPAYQDGLAVIRQSGESLLAILNDVLDLSKAEAGRLELEKIGFDLGAIVHTAQRTFAAEAAAKGVAFRLDLDPRAAGAYLGDPARVRQILCNLLSYAVKLTKGGHVALSIAWRDEVLEITVAASGAGDGATGFGLAVCRELAGLMGGAMEVETTAGAGARFTVLLPLRRLGDADTPLEPETAEERSAAALAEGGRPLRVLAAEDNAVNQLVLRTLLAQIGVHPDIVDDGAEAVQAWEIAPYDLILMDVEMPGMDGAAATRAIRLMERTQGRARTPILALTANAMQSQVAEYLADGFDGHLAKPIDAARLYASLAAVAPASPAVDGRAEAA